MHPLGVEPKFPASQASVLSIERRVQIMVKKTSSQTAAKYNTNGPTFQACRLSINEFLKFWPTDQKAVLPLPQSPQLQIGLHTL